MKDIPGYTRYKVIQKPFRIIDTITGEPCRLLNPPSDRPNAAKRVHLYDDTGKRRTVSIVTIAALAFHGQPPKGYIAHHLGGSITPSSIQYYSRSEVMRLRRQCVDEKTRLNILDDYWQKGKTQDAIAEQYGISQTSVCRIVNRGYNS